MQVYCYIVKYLAVFEVFHSCRTVLLTRYQSQCSKHTMVRRNICSNVVLHIPNDEVAQALGQLVEQG